MQQGIRVSDHKFNFFDAVQFGGKHFAREWLPSLKENLLLLAVIVIAFSLFYTGLVQDARVALAFAQLSGTFDAGAWFIGIVWTVFSVIVAVGFLAVVFTSSYAKAIGQTSRGTAFQLGTGDTPLFRMTQEQATVFKSSWRRFVQLWPIIIGIFAWSLAQVMGTWIQLAQLQGNGTVLLSILQLILRGVALYSGLWFFARVIRYFLYRPAIVVETGVADEDAITSPLGEAFPHCMKSTFFWSASGLIFLAYVPPNVLNWVSGGVNSVLDIEESLLGVLLGAGTNFLGWLLSAVFISGALAFARGKATAEPAAGDDTSSAV